jgi:MFS family permease
MPRADIRNTALLIAILAGFLIPFALSAVTIALPTLAQDFSMDAIQIGWVSTAYLLASAVFLVPFGRIADIYGRKRIFATGLSIFTLASFLMILAPSALAVILLRVLQGFGSAMIFGTAVAILTSVTPPEHRGKALGIYTTAVYLGLSMGPFFGGILTGLFGWRSVFAVNVPIGLFAVALIALFLKGEWADCRGERFDIGGSIQYGLTLTCVMYGFSFLPKREGFILLIAGAVMLVVFVSRELRIKEPLWNIRMFAKNRVFLFSNMAALINYGATFAVMFFLSLYLQCINGFSPEYAGMAISALSLVLLMLTGSKTPLVTFICILVILGIGLGLFSSPNTNAIMGSVERNSYGVASGTLGMIRLAGQMLSMGVAMVVLAVFVGNVQITPALYPAFLDGMKISMVVFAAMCIAGIFFSLVPFGKPSDAASCPR